MRITFKRTALAVIAVIALLATASLTALAGGWPGYSGPANLDGASFGYEPAPPWDHTVVVVHALEGAYDDGFGPVDISEIVGSAEDYINGREHVLVDVVITKHFADSSGYWGPHGFFGPKPWALDLSLPPGVNADNSGVVAQGLYQARRVCQSTWSACDVLLVTYEAPEHSEHRHQAMAEAMLLNQVGQLHTIAIEDGLNDLDHVEFSRTLGALGYHAQTVGPIDGNQQHFNELAKSMLEAASWTSSPDPWVDEYEVEEPESGCTLDNPDSFDCQSEREATDDEPAEAPE